MELSLMMKPSDFSMICIANIFKISFDSSYWITCEIDKANKSLSLWLALLSRIIFPRRKIISAKKPLVKKNHSNEDDEGSFFILALTIDIESVTSKKVKVQR